MQIDHLFIRAGAGAPEAELLRAFGLTEGSGNRHPGQGTQNRRFFFHNAFIELLWIADQSEALEAAVRPTMLAERLRPGAAASPFGICFRPAGDDRGVPFPHWDYAPPYLPSGMSIAMGSDVPLSEPLWFFLPRGSAPATYPAERRQPLAHAAGLAAITAVTLTLPAALSAPARAAREKGDLTFTAGDQPLLELTFDHGAQGKRHDFRPALPLIFFY
jgi:hypothetical protein